VSASEEMLREQLGQIIGRTEARVEQQRTQASGLPRNGDEARRVRSHLAPMLAGLAKLMKLADQISKPHPRPAHRPPADSRRVENFKSTPWTNTRSQQSSA
jgi:hypothetical protein